MTKKILSILTVITASIFLISACGGESEKHSGHDHSSTQKGESMHHEGAGHQQTTAEHIKQSYARAELKIGDKTICPVMGTKFAVNEKTKFATVSGKKYYVCCPSCIEKIEKEPDKYLK